jgi:hypothetical protein
VGEQKLYAHRGYTIEFLGDPGGRPRWDIRGRLRSSGALLLVAIGCLGGLLIAYKALWQGCVYREEWWLLGILVAVSLWLSWAVNRQTGIPRWIGWGLATLALMTLVALVLTSFLPWVTQPLANAWLVRHGIKFVFHSTASTPVSVWDVYVDALVVNGSVGTRSLGIELTEVSIPSRVLQDSTSGQLWIRMNGNANAEVVSETIERVLAVNATNPSNNIELSFDLNSLSDEEVRSLLLAGHVMTQAYVSGPISEAYADFLNAPSTGLVFLHCTGFSPEDFRKLEPRINLGSPALHLTLDNCQIDEEVARVVSGISRAVHVGSYGYATSVTLSQWRSIVDHQLKVTECVLEKLDPSSALQASQLMVFDRLRVRTLDAETVDALATSALKSIWIDELSDESVEAMIRNNVTWNIWAGRSNASIENLRTLNGLASKAGFSLQEKRNLPVELQILIK